MPTRPKNDRRSIAIDARRVLDAAREDLNDTLLRKRVSKHECDVFEANIVALEQHEAGSTTSLQEHVEAGVHAAHARAATVVFLRDTRDDARITFPNDPALQHAFGFGATPDAGSTAAVRHTADTILAAAHAHPTEAAKIGLDRNGIHHLEDLIHALDGADLAHVHTASARHTNTVHTDSLAHLVAAEAAHIRLAARRVFRDDPTRLVRYDRTLPRHEVVPRHPHVMPAPAATTT